MISGIYLITNKINNHMYVGGSEDIQRRIKEHKWCTNLKSSRVDKAIKKYGVDNFTYQIITELPADWEIIGEHEKYWIKFYNTFKNPIHYNLTEGGEGMSGFKHSKESIKKNKESQSGKNSVNWKNYARIVKCGFKRGKQNYCICFNGKKMLKRSISVDKLVKWFNDNYPDEELIIGEGIKY